MIYNALPLIGVCILAVAVICLLLPKLREGLLKQREPERIKAFGLDLRVSPFTLIVLVGVALIGPSVAFRYLDGAR